MESRVNQLIPFLWMAVFLIWVLTATVSKRTILSRSEGQTRLAVWVVWIGFWLLFSRGFRRSPLASRFVSMTPATLYIGMAITVAGLAFSVWARFYIGRNWSAFVHVKEDHQLIRSGPYAIVRHPIYSGFMFATLGTAIAFGEWSGLLAFVLIVTAWGYKARLEESAMVEQFGIEYERYRRTVKGLIPFIW